MDQKQDLLEKSEASAQHDLPVTTALKELLSQLLVEKENTQSLELLILGLMSVLNARPEVTAQKKQLLTLMSLYVMLDLSVIS
jgi:hypothetical protein